MENNQTNWTPFPDDNLLGLTDKNEINEIEAKGIANAELFVFELDSDVLLSTTLILEIQKIAFGELYDWAGKWRTCEVTVGQLIPPKPTLVLQAMYQFIDNLNFKISILTIRANILTVWFIHIMNSLKFILSIMEMEEQDEF